MEYIGDRFCGWQRQKNDDFILHRVFFDNKSTRENFIKKESYEQNNLCTKEKCDLCFELKPSVQATLEYAIRKITGQQVLVEGAGRTDAGVHALGQVAHFNLLTNLPPKRLLAGLNFYVVPLGVSVLSIELIENDFHARFSAKLRDYEYHILNRKSPLSLEKGRAWHVPVVLDIEAMREAALFFIGNHNFNAFRSSACQSKSAFKTIEKIRIDVVTSEQCVGVNGRKIVIQVSARSFLHNQIRIMVGTLVQIGKGKLSPNVIQKLLEEGDRKKAGQTAPASGLYFLKVHY